MDCIIKGVKMFVLNLYFGEKKLFSKLVDVYHYLDGITPYWINNDDEIITNECINIYSLESSNEHIGTIKYVKKGHLEKEITMLDNDGDIAVWLCPYCYYEKELEPDACGIITCEDCGKQFYVQDILCEI